MTISVSFPVWWVCRRDGGGGSYFPYIYFPPPLLRNIRHYADQSYDTPHTYVRYSVRSVKIKSFPVTCFSKRGKNVRKELAEQISVPPPPFNFPPSFYIYIFSVFFLTKLCNSRLVPNSTALSLPVIVVFFLQIFL